VESGEKTFELFVGDDIHLEKDDMVTLEEWDPVEQKYTGRYGATICGTLHPDFYTLQSLFNSRFLTGMILETTGNVHYEILNGPYYLPPLSTPEFYEMGLYERLSIDSWPIGVYDVVLLVRPDLQRDRFTIVDQRVTGCVYVVTEEGQGIEATPLIVQALQIGKTRGLDGRELQLADPEEVKKLTSMEEKADLPPDLIISDSLSRGTEDQLRNMLEEEGIDYDGFYEEEEDEG
jgi:hypothetical protein